MRFLFERPKEQDFGFEFRDGFRGGGLIDERHRGVGPEADDVGVSAVGKAAGAGGALAGPEADACTGEDDPTATVPEFSINRAISPMTKSSFFISNRHPFGQNIFLHVFRKAITGAGELCVFLDMFEIFGIATL